MKKKIILLLIQVAFLIGCQATGHKGVPQGAPWRDTDGNIINAHGGGVLYHEGTYYWYGEYKKGETTLLPGQNWECYRTDITGVSCYSSKDLLNWKYEGLVLKSTPEDIHSDLYPSNVLERPKVIYNKKTGKFVMWMHIDSADYSKACAGVAVCEKPNGEFKYLGSSRIHNTMSRDQTVFVDDDERAYHIFSSEDNATLYICELTDDYLDHKNVYTRNFVNKYREAPAIFKRKNKYYLLTSGCSAWDPNEAEYAIADSILGEWTSMGNPCRGENADKTFYGQSTYILPVAGKRDSYISMFDKWNKTDLENSRYIWLPISFKDEEMYIIWNDDWFFTIND